MTTDVFEKYGTKEALGLMWIWWLLFRVFCVPSLTPTSLGGTKSDKFICTIFPGYTYKEYYTILVVCIYNIYTTVLYNLTITPDPSLAGFLVPVQSPLSSARLEVSAPGDTAVVPLTSWKIEPSHLSLMPYNSKGRHRSWLTLAAAQWRQRGQVRNSVFPYPVVDACGKLKQLKKQLLPRIQPL